MGMTSSQTTSLYRLVFLLFLVGVGLFALTWSGIIKCGFLPAWCRAYNLVVGDPKILIVYGDSGLGNPIHDRPDWPGSLEEWLANPGLARAHADTMHVDRINLGALRKYRLVIVERARQMSTSQLKTFMDYVNTGGTLVWTGDAGVELSQTNGIPDVPLYWDEKEENAPHTLVGPWARRSGDEIVAFDEFLGVRYVANYCSLAPCPENQRLLVGTLKYDQSDKTSLAYGMSSALPLFVFKDQDFAITELIQGPTLTEHLYLDLDAPLVGQPVQTKGIPMITTNGAGGRVAYYALPPEFFANERLKQFPDPLNPGITTGLYTIPLENLYYGLLYGSSKIEKLEWS